MALVGHVLLLLVIHLVDGARILAMFPAPVHSHQSVFRPLMKELAKRGHHVTVITALPAYPNGDAPENLTEISVEKSLRKLAKKTLHDDLKNVTDIYKQQRIAFNAVRLIFDNMMTELRDFFQSGQEFDLIMGEACARFTLVLAAIFRAPFVQMSSYGGTFDTFSIVGAPIHPLLYPLSVRERFKNLTLIERVQELYEHYHIVKLYYDVEEGENEIARRHFGDEFPTFQELQRNIEMIFLNVHPIWDSNRPVPSNLIYLGGLNLQPEKELPMDLKSQLDASNGAIYMSFGSTVRSSILSQAKIDTFLDVLSKLPYTVFWKWDLDVDNIPDNVVVRKWYPQADLLRHPKVKLFITQGGLQSIDEAIDATVPMVGLPILWDQWYNVDKIVELQIGVMCNIHTAKADDFRNAITTVLNEPSFRSNMKKLRDVMNDQPQKPLERAVWWLEYVIRHKGAKHLKSPASNMSVIDYFEMRLVLSVAAVTLALALAVTLVSIAVIKYSLNKLFASKKKKD